MDIDAAASADSDSIRTVVRRSFRASYALSPGVIDAVVDERLDDGSVTAIDDGEAASFVTRADRGDDITGYVAGVVDGDVGEITRLHVDPRHRRRGFGTALLDRIREALQAAGVTTLRTGVLSANTGGSRFIERHGFTVSEHGVCEYAGEPFPETVYVTELTRSRTEQPVPDILKHDGETIFVEKTAPETGTIEPFFLVHRNSAKTEPTGFFCGHCGSVVDAVDGLEGITCDDCGNEHRPESGRALL